MSENASPVVGRPAVSTDRQGRHPARLIRSLPVRLALTLLSGLSVLPLIKLDWNWDYRQLMIGAVFGALVLVPFIEAPQAWMARALVLVAGAALIHWGAVVLTLFLSGTLPSQVAEFAIPGLAGALLAALLTAWVAPVRDGLPRAVPASLAGLAGGVVFAITPGTPGSDFSVWCDYVVWQLLVFLGFYFGRRLKGDAVVRT